MRLLAVACVTVIAFPLRGDEPIEVADRLILDVRVVDPDGHPVPDARITPWIIHSSRTRGLWREDLHGAPPEVITDQDGLTRLPYPAFHFANAETTHVTVDVMAQLLTFECKNVTWLRSISSRVSGSPSLAKGLEDGMP